MTPKEFQRVEKVFQRASTLAPPDRSRYLDDTCDGEPRVRAEVEALLARDASPHPILDVDTTEPEPTTIDVAAPSRVGPYRILGVLGTGAMGVVYRAEQENPRRLVALKLMRAGFSSAQALRRFRQEADLLGRLQHPGVATVIEAGTTSLDGGALTQPYFVMELVDGRPLLEHVRHHDLSVRARTELIVRICEAVEHAHLSGIVHRDLKPANILVTEDGTTSGHSRATSMIGQPKILDFGVARIMDADGVDGTFQTSAGELIGTLPYMSPEQIAGDQEAVDTRCDVYALGVILFEVLTDRRPHDIAGKSLAEAARILCEEPATPLGAVDRHLRGDLETIVTTATAKDLNRRYATVGMLAGDLRRYLVDEPILARPPTTLYQLRKFARRNRGLVTGFVAAMVVLVIGLVTSAALYARAEGRAELMRRALYAQRITLGQNAIESGDAREVFELLDACPPDLRHWEWRRLRLLADESEFTLRGHTGLVNDVVFTDDGRYVVTAGGYDATTLREDRERTARVWDTRDGTLVRTIDEHLNGLQSVAVSADGRTLATVSRTIYRYNEPDHGWLRLWDLDTGDMQREVAVHPGAARGLCFSDEGDRLFVGGGLGQAAALDLDSGEVAWASGAPEFMTALELTPDGDRLVGSSYAGVVTVWDVTGGDTLWSSEPHGFMVVHAIAVSPDGAMIATACKDRTVKILDIDTGDEIGSLPDIGCVVTAIAFGPDGSPVSGGEDGMIRIYDPATRRLDRVLLGHADAIKRLSFARDGWRLASASRDGTAKLWRLDIATADLVLESHGRNEVNRVAWSPDGTRIVTAGDDSHARVVDVRSGSEILALAHERQFVHAVDWSSDGSRIASLDGKGGLRLWDATTGERLAAWQAHDTWSWRLQFSPDGEFVASSARGEAAIWNGRTGEIVHRLTPGGGDIMALAWRPDGAVLASAGADGIITLWDAADGSEIAVWSTLELPIDSIAFHPDGTRLAVGDRAGMVHMFDLTGREIMSIKVHTGICETISFSPDGKRMLTGGRDGWMRLFEPRSGDHIMTLKEHRSGVISAVFSPDGTQIASTSRDFTARVWQAAPVE